MVGMHSAAIAALWVATYLPLASSKGCFLSNMEITLADGKRKQLKDVQVGDLLASFDEATGKPAASMVKATPKFLRERSHLMEIALPNARIHVTHDHPFWSRGRGGLVSAHPNETMTEYSLKADVIKDDEELEDEQQRSVGVSSVMRAPARSLTASSLRGTSQVEVMTLCMHPHHWFYVHGVRVHNKCFLPSMPVSLADGTEKELRHVNIGDKVSSWDEVLGRPVNSTVVLRHTFQRPFSHLMEISLPSASIHATHDHPFWSKGKNALVSLHPNKTREDYALDVQMMALGEELHGLHSEKHVPVVGIQPLAAKVHAKDDSADVDRLVDVMTLCLEPHHWYYVHGVRVHNKGGGCFAPWTPVLMSDHTQKPISEIRENDKVISWDERKGQTSVATVLGIAQFPAGSLLEVNLNTSSSHMEQYAIRQLHSDTIEKTAVPSQATNLIVTHDHPFYSARAGSLVSMDPKQSSEFYALNVSQMHENEVLRHYLGHDVHAQVRPWNGSVDSVMTLRLDRHHWFHVNGVRVHNKGGSGGSGGGGGGGGGFTRSVTTRSTASSYRGSYIGLVMLHGGTRRRYGRPYENDNSGKCKMKDCCEVERICYDTGLGSSRHGCACTSTGCPSSSQVSLCQGNSYNVFETTTLSPTGVGGQEKCEECMRCRDEACVQRIPKCETFVKQAYEYCETEEDEVNWVVVIIIILAVLIPCFGFIAYLIYKKKGHVSSAYQQRKENREHMEACNDAGLGPTVMFNGTYSELNETKPTTYNFNIDSAGIVTGQSRDDDGVADCNGKLYWPSGAPTGEMAWLETRPGVLIEVTANISPQGGGILALNASYDSTYQNTQGSLSLTCANSGFVAPQAVGVVVSGTVVGNEQNPSKV